MRVFKAYTAFLGAEIGNIEFFWFPELVTSGHIMIAPAQKPLQGFR